MSEKIIGSCCCCQFEGEVFKFKSSFPEEEHTHCDLCYTTLIGNSCVYKMGALNHASQGHVDRSIAEAAHWIVKQLRKEFNR